MREIKFRAWDEKNKRMSFFGLKELWSEGHFVESAIASGYLHGDIMQYTGLKDKNGKEIYEGDIVKYDTEDGIVTALVEWEESEDEDKHISGFVFNPFGIEDYPENCDDGVFEVIGNIYENPNLLAKGEK